MYQDHMQYTQKLLRKIKKPEFSTLFPKSKLNVFIMQHGLVHPTAFISGPKSIEKCIINAGKL